MCRLHHFNHSDAKSTLAFGKPCLFDRRPGRLSLVLVPQLAMWMNQKVATGKQFRMHAPAGRDDEHHQSAKLQGHDHDGRFKHCRS